ncbi:MAG: hypothetical protein WAO52_19005 [Prolixibacteraceae bacterium]
MENNNGFQEEYKKLDQEAAKYNRREFDLIYEIISELVKDRNDVGDNGNFALPLVKGEIIDEAIQVAGFSKDENFIADFKHYRDIEQKARDLQLKALEQAVKNMGANCSFENSMQKSGFIKSNDLQGIMDNIIAHSKEENPYFPLQAPCDEETKEDERLDQLFGSKGYNITGAWLRPYFDELKRYKVDALLNEIGFPTIDLFILIKKVGDDINNNSDKSIKLDNNILDVLKEFDEYPGSGQVIQLLFLLGIIKWFEDSDINEGDNGYDEAKSLLDRIVSRFIKIYVIYSCYFHKDEHSKPLDEFLANDNTITPFRLAMRERNISKGIKEADKPDNETDENRNNKKFIDWIITSKDKPKIISLLHEILNGKKGRPVAHVILALMESGMIIIPKPRTDLYESMRVEFGDIGTDQSINDILNPANEHKREKTLINSIVLKLSEIE